MAAALDQLGRVQGTAAFPTTVAGYRQLLAWLRQHGQLAKVGVEGTGSYGAALARHLAGNDVEVIEVARPNRQVRRRFGKTDVVDAIAAADTSAGADPRRSDRTRVGPPARTRNCCASASPPPTIHQSPPSHAFRGTTRLRRTGRPNVNGTGRYASRTGVSVATWTALAMTSLTGEERCSDCP